MTDVTSTGAHAAFTPPANLGRRKFADATFVFWGFLATALGLIVLGALVVDLFVDGGMKLTPKFFFSFPAPEAANAGIYSAWVGSILVIITTALIAVPVGVMAGLYLEEYAPRNWVTDTIEITVNNLAGVPSIIYGLLGLGVFVYSLWAPDKFWLGQTIAAAGLTLGLLILPVIIVACREAVRGVPRGIREAAMAVGATKWQATSHHVLPYATPGIVTGVIIGLSRALGETAPLIIVGVPTFVAFLPFSTMSEAGQTYYNENGDEATTSMLDVILSWLPWSPDGQGWLGQSFTVMPMQMFNWTSRPEREFLENAAAAGVVLLVITLVMNGAAIWLRYNMRKKIKW